jgi:ABC-2 type transport system ATP-binding protein
MGAVLKTVGARYPGPAGSIPVRLRHRCHDHLVTAIALHDIVKTFGSFRALDELHLTVEQGEVHGFLGPNGAGKSTTIRVLLGLLKADSGSASLLDGDPWREAAELHRRIAYVPGDVTLWPNLTGGEVIDVLGRMRGGLDEQRRAEMLERFELDPRKKARTYSKGNRQKVALVAALASRAELYLLDEPTSGLDPLMEAEFQKAVRELKQEGATVLLSSHILDEAEALADRISIIRAGRVVQSGSLAELRHLTRTTVIAETATPATGITGVSGVHNPQFLDGRVTFDVDSDHLDDAVQMLATLGVRSLTAYPPTLEELFLRQYGDEVTP